MYKYYKITCICVCKKQQVNCLKICCQTSFSHQSNFLYIVTVLVNAKYQKCFLVTYNYCLIRKYIIQKFKSSEAMLQILFYFKKIHINSLAII